MATLKDIADKSGYSIATVSRVLSNDQSLSVTDQTRKKIYEIAAQLNYRRKIVRPEVKNIVFLYWLTDVEELEDIYFKTMRKNIERIANDYHVNLSVLKVKEGIESVPKNTEGFIAVGSFLKAELEYLHTITPNGVFLDATPDPEYDSVRPDLVGTTKNAIKYLRELGHEKIGFIGGTYFNPDTKENEPDIREVTFREEMQKNGLMDSDFILTRRRFSIDTGFHLMKQIIETRKKDMPTAFFVAADPIAIGVLQALNQYNISVPERVSVVSINNISVTKYVSPPLTTFAVDIPELSRLAVELLIERVLRNRHATKTIYLGTELVERASAFPLNE